MEDQKVIDGHDFYNALICGINRIILDKDLLNKINVFPVPDGDTGTNLAFTLQPIIELSEEKIDKNISTILINIADCALDFARGNSGTIMAQFFVGMSEAYESLETFNAEQLSKSISMGNQYAREALENPTEGTIITVMKDCADSIQSQVDKSEENITFIFKNAHNDSIESLNNTPNLMELLKKSGVVDAGAQGFVDMIGGMTQFFIDGVVTKIDKESNNKEINQINVIHVDNHENINFRYCTECIVIGSDMDRHKMKEQLSLLGDSIIVAGGSKKVKVHIHTDTPEKTFELCTEFGSLVNQKADDMKKQVESVYVKQEKTNIAIVTDSGADFLDDHSLDIHVVPVRYSFGNVGYIDKVSQTPKEFYQELISNPEHPKTSQPTPGDFKSKYQYLTSHYEGIVSIHLPSKLSGTLQSALTAIKRIEFDNAVIIDSDNASTGLGLIVRHAAELAKQGLDINQIVDGVNHIIPKTHLYVAFNDLSYGVKGGRVPKSKKIITDLLHIRPVTTCKDGVLKPCGILFGTKDLHKKVAMFIIKKFDNSKRYRISIAHSNSEENGNVLLDILDNNFKNLDYIDLVDMSPALGVHAGPNSFAISVQELD